MDNQNNQGGGAVDIDSSIRTHREAGAGLQQGTRAYDKHIEEMEGLYRQKASLLTREEKPESIRNFRHDQSDLDPETGRPLSEIERQARADLDELRGDLQNQYGPDAVEKIGSDLIGPDAPFRDAAALDSFVERAGLSPNEQREALLTLGELNRMSTPDVSIPVEATIENVGASLKALWRDGFDANLEQARKVAVEIFGSIERWDDYAMSKGWANNPAAQTRAVVMLAKLGRRKK